MHYRSSNSLFHIFSIFSLLASLLGGALNVMPVRAATFQTDINGPSGSGEFGTSITVLPNGNFIVTDPFYDAPGPVANVGAVYLYNGATHALISTLTGSTTNDRIGESGITLVENGNYVIASPDWDGAAVDVGAVTWGSGTTGVSGPISAANSLLGSTASDRVGSSVAALTNGNYVVQSSGWDGAAVDVGAVTWGDGTSGTVGVVSAANSLVGSTGGDQIGYGLNNYWETVIQLTNGNYVVVSPYWDGVAIDVGAVTWGDGTSGTVGVVSESNSLVGSTANDWVGNFGVITLTNGNYVVASPFWDGAAVDVGAATWGNGTGGTAGIVSASNSLVGSTAGGSVGIYQVGKYQYRNGLSALTNGNYVVASPYWDGGVGAVTWGDGTSGTVGVVSESNSLVGSTANDWVGNFGVITLTNGNYVVASPFWDGVAVDVGAATWGNGTGGTVGIVSASNSLVGSTAGDGVTYTPPPFAQLAHDGLSVTALTNGNYVVRSPNWDGAAVDIGAVIWGNGLGGTVGQITVSNSLIGSTAYDSIGTVSALTNGNYVVASPNWDGAAENVGAVTWGNGLGGVVGEITVSNSLVGSTAYDSIGTVYALTNGNYVVTSPSWDGAAQNIGAVTWGSGTTGLIGTVSAANSLVGSTAYDSIGSRVSALTNGNYVVTSPNWDGAAENVGAVTWGNGTTDLIGTVSATNSLVGSIASDQVGGVTALTNGNYVVASPNWDNGVLVDSGALTLGRGESAPPIGLISISNSVLGTAASGGYSMRFAYDDSNDQLVVGRPKDNIVTLYIMMPRVTSSVRVDPSPTNSDSVDFTVTFSKSVIGVDPSDFGLTTRGVSGAAVSGVNGSGKIYIVSVNTGVGGGTIRLDLLDDNSIMDSISNPLGGVSLGDGNFATGETYTINRSSGGSTTGVFRPSNGLLYLKNQNTTGFADVAINYGIGGDYPIAGDWDGNGTATIGIYRNGSFYLRNSNTLGFADIVVPFGTPGDQPVVGDWNGDGVDTIGVYSNGQFLLRNTNSAGTADMSFYLGNPGDVGIAGDWNGDGSDTTGVFRPSNGVIFLKNLNTTGFADIAINYGLAGDKPVTGDWNNDGIDTIGVYRNAQFLLRNSNTIGFADIVFALGNPGDMPIAGNWDGIP